MGSILVFFMAPPPGLTLDRLTAFATPIAVASSARCPKMFTGAGIVLDAEAHGTLIDDDYGLVRHSQTFH